VIPREGVERSDRVLRLDHRAEVVIPREGVESLELSDVSANDLEQVIPREGVERHVPKPRSAALIQFK